MSLSSVIISFVAALLLAVGTAAFIIKKHPRRLIRGAVISAAVIAELALVAVLYAENYYKADEIALSYLEGRSDTVAVSQTEDGYLFDGPGASKALIFYPGGKVETEAYAPLMSKIAQRGIDCLLVDMPLRLAFTDMNAADRLIARYGYSDWYIGGHSLGGVAAASYAAENAGKLRGIVLLASYSTEKLDDGLRCLTAVGSKDGVLNMAKYERHAANLPRDAVKLVIDGGNHSGFGSYGCQSGDGEADITPPEQWDITARAVGELIGR